MATKYFCDGCDKELQATAVQHVDVLIVAKNSDSRTPDEYELCEHCVTYLKRESDPRKWTRCAPAPQRAARGF